jgi:hypothetical protein
VPSAPAGGAATPVALNIAGEAMLSAVLAAAPPKHLMIEVPAFMATDPVHANALRSCTRPATCCSSRAAR